MKNYKNYTVTAVCVMVIGITGCGNVNKEVSDDPIKTEITVIGKDEEQAESVQSSEHDKEEQADSEQEELKNYRQEREDAIIEVNGLVEGGSPDENNYSFDMSGLDYAGQFDTKEMTQAYAAAKIYVTDILGIKPNTKMTTYMCIDPKMLAIYEDEDKGVAAGYDNNNIFLCEYCNEEDVWQYLILVRDSKDSPWNVIHNGNSYKK